MIRNKLSKYLFVAHLCSCLLYLWFAFQWFGGLLIWMSIYLFGIPMLLFLLPLLGLMMFALKSRLGICLSFIVSLTPLYYFLPALENFPFKVQITAAGHMSDTSLALSWAILLSAILFFGILTISFIYCLKNRMTIQSKSLIS